MRLHNLNIGEHASVEPFRDKKLPILNYGMVAVVVLDGTLSAPAASTLVTV
jgi:hypothetical protein